jgi:hypothetical protein
MTIPAAPNPALRRAISAPTPCVPPVTISTLAVEAL